MQRYFLEVSYKGTLFSGFQVQENATTVQSEIENAFLIFFGEKPALTGSSRTDAGVHALQNFFHFDTELNLTQRHLYNLNAILPPDIVLHNLYKVEATAHSRFAATARSYQYHLYQYKNPFLQERAWYYPYPLNLNKLNEAAALLMQHHNFTSFSKRNTQVNNFLCTLMQSEWKYNPNTQCLTYYVTANRFLRGMVKALVGTMLQVGKEKISLAQFNNIIEQQNCNAANFTPPSCGLFLVKVHYPEDILINKL